MVGFREVAVQDSRDLDLRIVPSILENRLDEFLRVSARALKGAGGP